MTTKYTLRGDWWFIDDVIRFKYHRWINEFELSFRESVMFRSCTWSH